MTAGWDEVSVVRDFEGTPPPDYPPKAIVEGIRERYRITEVVSVDYPADGKIRVQGRAQH